MNDKNDKAQPPANKTKKPGAAPPAPAPLPPLYRRVDWLTFAATTFLVLLGYIFSLAPDLTLEDSGELAVASYYAGVPHPPGYPVWTLYTWLFTVLVPFSNIAWRVALSSAVAGALACGLIGLMVSRGSSMMLESMAETRAMDKRWENALCAVAGLVAGMLMGFNGFFWSQAVIVEVYTLSVLSLVGVLCFLLRWLYEPARRACLYWALFLFGICFTNHQTLVVAAVGIEVLILARDRKLGRDLFLANSVIYVIGLIAMSKGVINAPDKPINSMILNIFHFVGIGSLLTCGWLALQTRKVLTEWKPVLIMGLAWLAGISFYLYMPIASMTNPPLNWGYPRTVEGFKHALTRGQYESAKPTDDPMRFIGQLGIYAQGAIDEFNFVYLVIGLLPFVFWQKMGSRERAWIAGLAAVFLCLAILLLILLNPSPDLQSLNLNRVFFTSSQVIIAMAIGYGVALLGGVIATQYAPYRQWMLWGSAAAAGLAFYAWAALETVLPLTRYAAVFALLLALAAVGLFAWRHQGGRPPLAAVITLFALMPIHSVVSHWWDNEQRGHLFGYWFGHDMFTPPYEIYPEMARDAILFGGTDPGRFNPTYMIFCESFIPPGKKRDPNFDRRDVYLITQNALADGTYLSYIRAHYHRSAQVDPPFFQEALRRQRERELNVRTNALARAVSPLDRVFTRLGEKIEARRRADGVYPPKEIYTPSNEDSQRAFEEYVHDAQRRMKLNQLRPGEDVRIMDNRLQVSGQVAVMAINALLTKVIFDRNPGHEFYVEESFPLDWMYPHLTPHGIIMKINREPVPEFTAEIVGQDHEFWSRYSERLIGNWITYDTPVQEIIDFAERVYLHGDFRDFKGDPKFVRDDNAQKAFSKLRSAIGGLYVARINSAKSGEEQQRLIREADFAFRQSFAFCPYSPEAVYRYVNLLISLGRIDDALLISGFCLRMDPENLGVQGLVEQLRGMKQNQALPGQPGATPTQAPPAAVAPQAAPPPMDLAQVEQAYRANPRDLQNAINLVSAYWQTQRPAEAVAVLDRIVQDPESDANALTTVAQVFIQLSQADPSRGLIRNVETALQRLVQVTPESPEAWYDLASIQAALAFMPELANKRQEAGQALRRAIALSDERLKTDPNARDLRQIAAGEEKFKPLREMPEFKALFPAK